MIATYLRIAYRSLRKNQLFTYINVLGLAISMTAFLFLIQYVRFEYSYESFHVKADDIFRVTTLFYNGSELVANDCETFAPLGPLLQEKLPEVKAYARMYGIDGLINVKTGDKNFLETGMYWADHSVFDVFTYKVLSGQAENALTAPFEVVMTESMAIKYFGRADIIGESIEIDKHAYHVKAVVQDVPPNSHLSYKFLLSRLSFPVVKPWYTDDKWNNNNEYTYILTAPGTDLKTLNEKISKLITGVQEVIPDTRFVAEHIKDIHLYSQKSYEPSPSGNARTITFVLLMAFFVIVIAWVNYVNLSTARSLERAREVGVRKVMGSLRSQLMWQFLSESLIANALAGVIALIILQLAFPLLRMMSGLPTELLLDDHTFWLIFGALVMGGTLLSGIYPAIVLSSFKPSLVLKGKLQSSSHGRGLRKALVVVQFSITVVLMISLCTVYLQVKHLRNIDLGMNFDQMVVITGRHIRVENSVASQKSRALKSELLRYSEFRQVGRGESLPGVDIQELSTTTVTRVGKGSSPSGYVYSYIGIDQDYIPTLAMTLAAGRNFEDREEQHDQVIINETAARMLGFVSPQEAVGQLVSFRTRPDTEGSKVIGVLKDFYFRSPKEPHLPMLFYYSNTSDYFAIRTNATDMQSALTDIQSAWNRVYPGTVLSYFFLDDKYNQQYFADVKFGNVMASSSLLIVVIACLGLFGLSSYTIIQRTKEIGVRKVLGASVTGIMRLLCRDFIGTVLMAALLALPAGYWLMEEWLSTYAVRIEQHPLIFAGAVLMVVLLALLTVGTETFRAATRNPVDAIKHE
jgi:putative ABC transport system permease protein